MKRSREKLFLVPLCSLCLLTLTHATNRYVSALATGTQDGSLTHPFATIQAASDLTNPGDTVFVMNGTYTNTYSDVVTITRSGSASAWTVYTAYPGHHPLVHFNGWQAFDVYGSSYIEISGFEVVGNNANMDSATAYSQRTNGNNPLTSGNGMTAQPATAGSPPFPHHIVFRNNVVHDCGGGGLETGNADCVTIEDNVVYNNAWYSCYDCSGISIGWCSNFDSDTTDYRIIVRRNLCYNNKDEIPAIQGGGITDGEGIIIDIQDGTAGGVPAYTGRMLVANNICFGNGGDGITLFRSNHVDVINNTVYLNDQSPSINRGGICPNQTQNSTIMNNIIFAPAGKMAMAGNPLVADYNLYWSSSGSPSNSLIQTLGTHDRKADPLFINASLNSALADFHVQYGSPAIDGGASVVARVGSTVNAPTTDFSGNMRPSGGGYDIGAYEYVPTRAEPGNAMHAVVPSQLTVSPNPCRGIAGIQLGSTGDVRIMPMNGAAVDAFHSVRSAQWDTRALPAGMYTVEANTGGVRLSRELVVVK